MDYHFVRSADLVQLVGAAVSFEISSPAADAPLRRWLLDLRPATSTSSPAVLLLGEHNASSPRPEVSIHCTDDTLLSLASGKLSAEGAFLRGLLKVKGRMAVALKVKSLLAIANDSIKKRGNQ